MNGSWDFGPNYDTENCLVDAFWAPGMQEKDFICLRNRIIPTAKTLEFLLTERHV